MTTKKSYPSAHIGTPLLLVLLFTLCLSALAVLTLSDALRTETYSNQVAENTRNYYQADTQAKIKLAGIQDVLMSASDLEQMQEQIEFIDGTIFENEQEDCRISYDVPIQEDLILHVVLNVEKERTEDGYDYQIEEWQEQSLATWNTTTTLPVLGSD